MSPALQKAIVGAQEIHEFLRQCHPVWTRELPTKEGYYWMRSDRRDAVTVVKIYIDHGETGTPWVVQEGHPAKSGAQYLRDYRGNEWAGPLEEPKS